MAEKQQNVKHSEEKTLQHQAAQPAQPELSLLPWQAGLRAYRRTSVDPDHVRPANLLALQRLAGNQAVSHFIQTKLTVGPAGDRYEQEADRVAEQVIGQPSAGSYQPSGANGQKNAQRQVEEEEIQTKPLAASITPLRALPVQRQEDEEEIQTKPQRPLPVQRQEDEEEIQMKPLVQRQEDEEEVQTKPLVQRQEDEEEIQTKPQRPLPVQRQEDEEEVQTKPQRPLPVQRQEEEEEVQTKSLVQRRADGGFEAGPQLESRLAAQKGGGSPLPDGVRASMEPSFGADFSGVRVHTGGEAAQLNRALNSKAFTHGQDIYFKGGEYSPETLSGQKLLAHELTHTLQQGASRHIRGWWPQGHKLVTKLALEQDNVGDLYFSDVRNFLIDRSPDIDFIQDQSDTMVDGIKKSAGRIALYEAHIKHGNSEAAQDMWDNNDLHYRDPAYCMSHGEGGLYKQADPADVNQAMTVSLVNKAARHWSWGEGKWDKRAKSLAILSDALHQAEDRGSHGEGREFSGHDVRLNIKTWAKQYKRQLQPWEKWRNAPPEAAAGNWDPDNFSINKRGAVLGIGFAQGVLKKFAADVGASPEKRIGPIQEPSQREMKAEKLGKAWETGTMFGGTKMPTSKSSDTKAGLAGKSGKGGTAGAKEKELRKVFGGRQELEQLAGSLRQGEYEQATQAPTKGTLSNEDKALVLAGRRFYRRGAGFEHEFKLAEAKFREWGKAYAKKGGKKKSDRRALSLTYLTDRVNAKEGNHLKLKCGKTIMAAYAQVFHAPLPGGEARLAELVPTEQQVDPGKVYMDAFLQFKEWAKARTKKGGKKESERKRLSVQYHNERVGQAQDADERDLISQAILYAYEAVFNKALEGVTIPQM